MANRSRRAVWHVFYHSSEMMDEVRANATQLVIASPPFTNQRDCKTLDKKQYLDFIERVFSETHRVLKPSGILVTVNTDLRDHARYNSGNTFFDGLLWQKHGDIRRVAEGLGFRCVDTKIWAKSLKRNMYRYTFAYLQVFRKPAARRMLRGCATPAFAPDVWLLEGGSRRQDSRGCVFRDAIHPEIVSRCIDQFTRPGDLVVCPFTGSGTVIAVARLMARRCIGYEINRELEPMIRESIEKPELFAIYREPLRHSPPTGTKDPRRRVDAKPSLHAGR